MSTKSSIFTYEARRKSKKKTALDSARRSTADQSMFCISCLPVLCLIFDLPACVMVVVWCSSCSKKTTAIRLSDGKNLQWHYIPNEPTVRPVISSSPPIILIMYASNFLSISPPPLVPRIVCTAKNKKHKKLPKCETRNRFIIFSNLITRAYNKQSYSCCLYVLVLVWKCA